MGAGRAGRGHVHQAGVGEREHDGRLLPSLPCPTPFAHPSLIVRVLTARGFGDAPQYKDVNYINAHATSTPAGDMAEVRRARRLLRPL
jgi:acyl transferase domain-containing protein